MNIDISHVYREENMVADSLSKFGFSLPCFMVFDVDSLPVLIRSLIVQKKHGI